MADVLGVLAIVVFYLLILLVGLWAGQKHRKFADCGGGSKEEVMLAGRNIGMVLGIFTMTGIYFEH